MRFHAFGYWRASAIDWKWWRNEDGRGKVSICRWIWSRNIGVTGNFLLLNIMSRILSFMLKFGCGVSDLSLVWQFVTEPSIRVFRRSPNQYRLINNRTEYFFISLCLVRRDRPRDQERILKSSEAFWFINSLILQHQLSIADNSLNWFPTHLLATLIWCAVDVHHSP